MEFKQKARNFGYGINANIYIKEIHKRESMKRYSCQPIDLEFALIIHR